MRHKCLLPQGVRIKASKDIVGKSPFIQTPLPRVRLLVSSEQAVSYSPYWWRAVQVLGPYKRK